MGINVLLGHLDCYLILFNSFLRKISFFIKSTKSKMGIREVFVELHDFEKDLFSLLVGCCVSAVNFAQLLQKREVVRVHGICFLQLGQALIFLIVSYIYATKSISCKE